MLRRIVSFVIIISMLWGDIAAAMDDQDESPLPISTSLVVKKRSNTGTSPKEFIDTTPSHPLTEKSSLLVNGTGEGYQATKLAIVPSSNGHSVNGHTKELTIVHTNGHKNPKKHIRVGSSSSDEEDRKSTDKVDSLDELEFKLKPKKSACCWPFSCCTKGSSQESYRDCDHLLIIESDTSLGELKKQLLLRLVVPSEIPSEDNHLTDVIHVEEVDDREILLQKVRFLYQKLQGTPLEDFGRWFQGHVVENRYRWQDWGGLFIALCMATGTGAAMAPIVEYSIYNSFFAHHLKEYMKVVGPLAYYTNGSTALTTLEDAASFMPEATSPSTRSFTTPKSAKEKRADRILIPLAAISGIYLLLLGFQVQQILKKDDGSKGFWTNPHDQFWLATAVPLFSYLVAQTWRRMRTAVSKVFHPTVSEHVKERVLALRQLEARLDSYSDEALDDLYDLLKHPLLAQDPKFKAWARYFCKGEIAEKSKVEGLLTYLTLTNYAQEKFKEEVELEEEGHKTRKAARILAALGLPAGASLVAISVFGLFSAFMGWQGALALSITAAALGFVPESFLQAHNVQETLDDINAKESGPKRGWKENVKDPYWWGAGAAKVLGLVCSAFQNILTNLAPIFVSLVMLTPQELGGGDTVQKAMTWTMITLAVPYLISELISGTHDMWGHLVGMTYAVHDFVYGLYDRIVACCGKEVTLSPRRQKREIRRILGKAIETTVHLSPTFVEDLDAFERKLKGEEDF